MIRIAFALALLASPALAQQAERAALDECFADRARQLDDGSSDARSIATGLISSCSVQRRAVVARMVGKPADHADVARIFLDSREVAIDRATEIVLTLRAERRRKP